MRVKPGWNREDSNAAAHFEYWDIVDIGNTIQNSSYKKKVIKASVSYNCIEKPEVVLTAVFRKCSYSNLQ